MPASRGEMVNERRKNAGKLLVVQVGRHSRNIQIHREVKEGEGGVEDVGKNLRFNQAR